MSFDTAPRIVTLSTGRRVGFRRFGEGPAAVLLHASPRSAAALLPLGCRLADRHTVYAFDSPGFGWSDPLPLPRPDAADFGDALIEAFDALGIAKAAIYGSHTGAAVAVAAAARHPARVSALALDGYAMFTPTEQAEYLANYLAPIRPTWDGTHLAFLWSRVRDQFTFFPWYLNAAVARLKRPRPSLDFMQGVVVDFLAAGDHYRAGYAAAFRADGAAWLRRQTVRTTVMCRSDDLLYAHLGALGDLPPCVTTQALPADDLIWAEAVHVALSQGEAAIPPAVADAQMMRVAGGVIAVTRHERRQGQGRPLVLLPGIPGSARGEAALARALAGFRPVLAVDLPGFGGSSLKGTPDATKIAVAIAGALGEMAGAPFDIVAIGESAAIARALRAAFSGALVLVDPVPDAAREDMLARMTDIAPRPDGSHLLAAWHQLRDSGLWRPWFAADPAHAIPNGTDPDVQRLHAILTDWMRGGTEGRRTLAAAMAQDLSLDRETGLVLLADHAWSSRHGRGAAGPARLVGDDHHGRAEAIIALLDHLALDHLE